MLAEVKDLKTQIAELKVQITFAVKAAEEAKLREEKLHREKKEVEDRLAQVYSLTLDVHTHTHTVVYTHIHNHTHTRTHTRIHTHTHTHTQNGEKTD